MDKDMTNARMFDLQRMFGDGIRVVDPKRDFKGEEPMTIVWRKQPKSVIAYFCSDLLLVSDRLAKGQKLLTYLYLTEESFCRSLDDPLMFSVIGKNDTLTFIADNDNLYSKVVLLLNEIFDNLKEKE